MTWADTEHSYKDAEKAAKITTMWMQELGGNELSEVTGKAAMAFDLVVQTSKIAGLAGAMMAAKNSYQEGITASLTAAKAALGPIGWGQIALATGAAASTAVLVGAITHYKLRADLEQPSGMEAVKQFIGNVI